VAVTFKRNGNPNRVRAEIVIVDQEWRKIPAPTGVLEVAHQFPLLGVDADNGLAAALESVAKIADVEELLIAVGTGIGGNLLVIDAKRVAHLVEKAGYGSGAHDDAKVAQRHGDLLGRAARPLQAGDRIACRVVLQ
jgi:hypothetical protein